MQIAHGYCPGSPPDAGDGQGLGLCRGEVDFGGSGKKRSKFVKVPSSVAPSVLFDLLLAEWHLPAPNLVVSLVGEERPFAMKSWLRDVLRKGLVKAAQSTGAWILTSALRVGLARHVGQAVRDHSLASTSTKVRVVAIGIASLGRILHHQLLDDAQGLSTGSRGLGPQSEAPGGRTQSWRWRGPSPGPRVQHAPAGGSIAQRADPLEVDLALRGSTGAQPGHSPRAL
ncbi:Hypothetical predicted protein [Marmota monax]|uniref:TRPM SLOG domain-containing protein n=1 Tax=Marmota monax TaxID=9995 RepID=A0A5E4D7C0_MARMO|nr:Hypothetical predicted protein [Marmota monax]